MWQFSYLNDRVNAIRTSVWASCKLKQARVTVSKYAMSTFKGSSRMKWVIRARGSCIIRGTLLCLSMSLPPAVWGELFPHWAVRAPHNSDKAPLGTDLVGTNITFIWMAKTCIKGTEKRKNENFRIARFLEINHFLVCSTKFFFIPTTKNHFWKF